MPITKEKQIESALKLLKNLLIKDYYGCMVVKIHAGNIVHISTERMYRTEDLMKDKGDEPSTD